MQSVFTMFLLATVCLAGTACGPTIVYEEAKNTGAMSGWAYADSLTFTYDVPSAEQPYDLVLTVGHDDNFPYENFYLNIHTRLPNGKRTTERISLDLSGDFGEWFGDCSGGVCELEIPILKQTRYQESGTYTITLEQNSRDNPLPAINTVGLRLVEAEGQ